MRTSLPSSLVKIFLICCFAILAFSSSFANVSGAIFTTTSTGATVNGNIYANKADVYLNGGPQNKNDPGLVPDGTYYFQVTDPSGSVLLSLDDISCREVVVSGGRIIGVPTTPAPGACVDGYHNLGTPDLSNGQTPVQLCNPISTKCPTDFADTPNPGGEYKAWLTPTANYSPSGQPNCSQPSSHMSFGFCDSDSKTDNFKIRVPGTASITACKFIDVDGDSTYDPGAGDYLISGWQITASGVDGGTVAQTTDQDGCTTFTYTFPKGVTTDTVTLTEVLQTGWNQVAPTPLSGTGSCILSGSTVNASDTCSVTDGVITATISPNDIAVAPFFGNALGAPLVSLEVSKTAAGGNMFKWNVSKSVDKTEIDDSNGMATFNYTVTVTHDAGTGWQVQGNISVYNPNSSGGTDGSGAIDGVTITDSIDHTAAPFNGSCNVNGTGTSSYGPVTVNGGATLTVPYTCTFAENPVSGTNTLSVTWDPLYGGGSAGSSAPYDFTAADTSATITDTIAGSLGSVAINADNSTSCTDAATGFTGSGLACNVSASTTTFTYSETFTDPAGTCTSHDNTATYTTNTNTTGSSSDVTVKQCVGEDLKVVKTATTSLNSSIAKSVDKTKVEQSGGNVIFNYTVTVTESGWQVTGTVTVSNPNDWEPITANVTDTIDSGGTCLVTGGTGVVIAASSSSAPLSYTCTYTKNPTLVSGTNTGTATVTAGITPDSAVHGTAPYTFTTLTVTDNVQSSAYPPPTGCGATLGTVSVTTTTPSTTPGCGVTGLTSSAWGVFKYAITDANANPGTCSSYNNTATITGGSSSSPVTVTVCNTNIGALTMGFWKNTNGQKIINAGGSTSGVCNSGTWLRLLDPFKDLSATATCKQVATYVNTVLGAATCGGSTCNPMLKAQMLATALDVYFSPGGGGGNQIGGYNGLGSKTPDIGTVAIDLSHVCSMVDGSSSSSCSSTFEDARPEFGILATCQGATVNTMLVYSNYLSLVNGSPVSNVGGSNWYVQNKVKQVIAKDSFDSTNNDVAPIATGTVCTSTF